MTQRKEAGKGGGRERGKEEGGEREREEDGVAEVLGDAKCPETPTAATVLSFVS